MRRKKLTLCAFCGKAFKHTPASSEDVVCQTCNCTYRAHEVCLAILRGLGYSQNFVMQTISPDLSRVGLGISDDWRLARELGFLFTYTNSYLHQFPTVDLCSPPQDCLEYFEFISCSDVLEHTPPPIDRPINGLYRMLKPGGFAVISVPVIHGSGFMEFYPDLVDWELRNSSVFWTDSNDTQHVDHSPVFHGGHGLTLAFRQWTQERLIEELLQAGFIEIEAQPVIVQRGKREGICLLIARKSLA